MTLSLAITPGEPAGIGPDLCVALAQDPPSGCELVVFADGELLTDRARRLDLPLSLKAFNPDRREGASRPGELSLVHVDAYSIEPGSLEPRNASYVLGTLKTATEWIRRDRLLDALVTGPVHKGNINEGGYPFTGHTEYLADLCEVDLTVMMLATEGLRVALATTHLPLAKVPGAINAPLLQNIIRILDSDLRDKFGIPQPRILVCGLNPHAGEGGHLGREEIEIIEPVLKGFRDQGLQLIGPLPADTLFTPKNLAGTDAVLAMYHDQGLPVLKYKGFGQASNITLGLPIIRTSVDHGTALDLAGSGGADPGSLRHAIATALFMAKHWKSQ